MRYNRVGQRVSEVQKYPYFKLEFQKESGNGVLPGPGSLLETSSSIHTLSCPLVAHLCVVIYYGQVTSFWLSEYRVFLNNVRS